MGYPASRFTCLVFILACTCTCHAIGKRKEKNVFRTGAVLTAPGGGPTDEMEEARMGYELFTRRVNALDGDGFVMKSRDNANLRFKFSFEARDDGGSKKRHGKELDKLLSGKKAVHFVYGSHPEFADIETQKCNDAQRINYHCCVGPDEIYERGYRYVFGIQTSNTKYSELALKSMALKSFETLGVILRVDNPFTRSTCEAAIRMAEDSSRKTLRKLDVNITAAYNSTEMDELAQMTSKGGDWKALKREMLKDRFKEFATEAKINGVQSVVACAFVDDGELIVDAFTELEYPLKAMFLTVGPTKQQWVESTNNSAYLLSAVQWHKELQEAVDKERGTTALVDKFFGTPEQYASIFESLQGSTATYLSAGASAVGFTLFKSITDAMEKCDIGFTKGDVDELLFGPPLNCSDDNRPLNGYERVRLELRRCDIRTFFGHLRFNEFQRNVAKDPITTQVLGTDDECRPFNDWETLAIEAVLPTELANRELKMPACNPFLQTCQPGYKIPADSFDPCEPCQPGTFSDLENSDHCEACPEGMYNNLTAATNCTVCPSNTRSMRNQTDITGCHCKVNFFSPSKQPGMDCLPCPEGATCEGDEAPIVPAEGFWADTSAAEISDVYECPLRSACLGNGTCSEGYMGRVCDDCMDGYFKGFAHCFKCIPSQLLVSLLVLLVAVWYLLNDIISRSLPSVEIMLSWAQLANVIGDLDLRWPSSLEIVFGVANIMDFDVDIVEPTCFKASWTYAENFFVQLALPFILGGVAMIGYILSCILGAVMRSSKGEQSPVARFFRLPRDRADLDARWDATVAAFLSSIEITYITIAKYCFDSFKCEDMHGVSVLSASPDIECGSREHDSVRAQGAVGILFYVIGFPVYVVWVLYSLHRKQAFSDPVALRRYGFLYQRYELAYSWTGLVVLLRRCLFVGVLVFLHNAAFQVAILAAIIISSLMLHVYTAPYVDTYLDWLFSILLISLLIECFGGMMFYANNLPDLNRHILEVFVLVGLGLLVLVFVITFVWELRQTVEIYWLRHLHCRAVLHKDMHFDDDYDGVGRWEMKKRRSEVSKELLHTFDPHFVYRALKDSDTEMFMRWDKLSDMLTEYIADRSETSYLSLTPVAHFWRKLVERFPELVDFLAMTDEATRDKFKSFATKLYNDFYLKKKVERGPIYKMLNWRDRAPLAQWLAMAEEEDLQFFKELIIDMYKSQHPKAAEEMERKIQEQGSHQVVDPYHCNQNASALCKLCCVHNFTRVLSDKSQILEEISEGLGPLRHSAQKKILTQAIVATAAAKFKAGSKLASAATAVAGKPDGHDYPLPPRRGQDGKMEGGGHVAGCGKSRAGKPDREIISCSFSSEDSLQGAAPNDRTMDMDPMIDCGAAYAYEDWEARPRDAEPQGPRNIHVEQGTIGDMEDATGTVDMEGTQTITQVHLLPENHATRGRRFPTLDNRGRPSQEERRQHSGNFALTVLVEDAH